MADDYGITSDAPPEQVAAVEASKAKLAAMTSKQQDIPAGRTTSTRDAARVAAENTAPPSYTEGKAADDPVERRRQELTKSPDGIFSKDPAKAKAAQDEMRKLLASGATQEEKDAFANLPIGTLRDAHGVTAPDLPSHLKDRWSTELEAEGLIAMQENGIEQVVVQDLHKWYVQRGIQNLGRFGEEDVAAFREFATKKGLAPAFIQQLIEWHGGDA